MNDPVAATRRMLLRGLALMIPGAAAAESGGPVTTATPRVVYHVDDLAHAVPALRNASNHLKAAAGTQIVMVALGPGIDFLLRESKDERGNPFEPMVDDLVMLGVAFRVCNNTLVARGIDRSRVHPEAAVVESGVAEITRLQFHEGFAYVKP